MNKTDSNFSYCQQKAAPEGSSLYYATLYYSKPIKHALITLHAFYLEVSEIIYECTDPGVARIKLNWWLEEIQRLINHNTRHPVSQQLMIVINDFNLEVSRLVEIIETFENNIHIEYPNESSRNITLEKTMGNLWQCSANITGICDLDSIQRIRQSSCVIKQIDQLNTFFRDLHSGRCNLSNECLKQYELKREQLSEIDPSDLWSRLLLSEYRTHIQRLTELNDLHTRNNEFLFGIILIRIYQAICKKYLSKKKTVITGNIQLLPLIKLWYAWSSYKRYGSK